MEASPVLRGRGNVYKMGLAFRGLSYYNKKSLTVWVRDFSVYSFRYCSHNVTSGQSVVSKASRIHLE